MKSRRKDSSTGKSSEIYGVNPVLEALRAGRRTIAEISVAIGAKDARLHELIELARASNVPVSRLPRPDLDRLARNDHHQGVVARVAATGYADPDDLLNSIAAQVGNGTEPLAIILDGVEDPHNLGAMLRVAECGGVNGVFIPERRAVGLTEAVAKASAGAIEHVPVARVTNVSRLIDELKKRNVWVIGTGAKAEMLYTDWDWTRPSALVMGSEGSGLHRLVREKCDALVKIPVYGHIESLNVSVAAGIILYEALRQRTSFKNKK